MQSWFKRVASWLNGDGLAGKRVAGARRTRKVSAARRPFLETLEGREMMTVTYHGGALLEHVAAQAVYLGSDWNSNASLKSQRQDLDDFVSYIVDSPYMDMLTDAGYRVGRGTSLPGVVGPDVNNSTGISDKGIHNDLQQLITAGKVAAPNANRLYVVFVEPGTKVKLGRASSVRSFLGYHGAFGGRDANGNRVDIRYAVMPYPGRPNPSPGSQGYQNAFDELTSVASHEIAEAVTDPDVNYKRIGWYDDRRNGEIADLTNKEVRLNGYLVQAVVNKNDRVIVPKDENAPLSAPQNVVATSLSATSARVRWDIASGAKGYHIYRTDGDQPELLGTVGATEHAFVATNLPPNATVSFVIEAYDDLTTAAADPVSVKLEDVSKTTLIPPVVTPIVLSPTAVRLRWQEVDGARGYRVFYKKGSRLVLLGTVRANTTHVRIVGLAPGETVKFVVQAFRGADEADSSLIEVTTPRRRNLSGGALRMA